VRDNVSLVVPISHGLATALVNRDGKVERIWRGNAWTPAEVTKAIQAESKWTALLSAMAQKRASESQMLKSFGHRLQKSLVT